MIALVVRAAVKEKVNSRELHFVMLLSRKEENVINQTLVLAPYW